MRRSLALALGAVLTCAMAATPVLADTTPPPPTSTTNSVSHDIDCFGLLFSDPAKHAQECGTGPSFTPPAPPVSGGDGSCVQNVEIDPMLIPDLQIKSDADLMVAKIECSTPAP